MEKGGNMKRVFERFCRGLKEVSTGQPRCASPMDRQIGGQADRGKEGRCGAGPLHSARAGWCCHAKAWALHSWGLNGWFCL